MGEAEIFRFWFWVGGSCAEGDGTQEHLGDLAPALSCELYFVLEHIFVWQVRGSSIWSVSILCDE